MNAHSVKSAMDNMSERLPRIYGIVADQESLTVRQRGSLREANAPENKFTFAIDSLANIWQINPALGSL
jgi:hypothetical protein